jgi:MFS family permease
MGVVSEESSELSNTQVLFVSALLDALATATQCTSRGAEPVAGDAVMYGYLGLAAGDLVSGLLSQQLKSRKKVVAGFILLSLGAVLLYLFTPFKSTSSFYITCFVLGFGIGYWALFVTIAAEQFGTNLRSTVATSVPNIIRGTVIPLTFLFKYLRDTLSIHYTPLVGEVDAKNMGIIYGALTVGLCTVVIAFIALRAIDETYGRDLDFEEVD